MKSVQAPVFVGGAAAMFLVRPERDVVKLTTRVHGGAK